MNLFSDARLSITSPLALGAAAGVARVLLQHVALRHLRAILQHHARRLALAPRYTLFEGTV